jgi:hypothetical protein
VSKNPSKCPWKMSWKWKNNRLSGRILLRRVSWMMSLELSEMMRIVHIIEM